MSIDKLRARYDASEVRSKVFFKGTESEMTIYTKPMTAEDQSKVALKQKVDETIDDVDITIFMIMEKALNENGDKIFEGAETRVKLKEMVKASDIAEIAAFINDSETDEELKNG